VSDRRLVPIDVLLALFAANDATAIGQLLAESMASYPRDHLHGLIDARRLEHQLEREEAQHDAYFENNWER
jgi:hypothetical protein